MVRSLDTSDHTVSSEFSWLRQLTSPPYDASSDPKGVHILLLLWCRQTERQKVRQTGGEEDKGFRDTTVNSGSDSEA